ncbi:MAG: transglutaminase domain-containing protein [Lachnospiraceae bacterium]|nr:transglutaminase domain-containing protein [Lachnospiraceae bacterium]
MVKSVGNKNKTVYVEIEDTNRKEIRNKNNHRRSVPFIALLFMICGITGIILMLNSINGFDFNLFLVLTINIMLCIVLHYSYAFDRRLYLAYVGLFLVATEIDVIFNMQRVLLQLRVIVDAVQTGIGTLDVDLNEAFVILTIAITLLMGIVEYIASAHTGFIIITGILVIVLPILGVKHEIFPLILITVFQFGMLTVQLPMPKDAKDLIRSNIKSDVSHKTAIALLLMISIVAALAVPVALLNSDNIMSYSYDFEKWMTRGYLRGNRAGYISRGNNYRNGTKYLVVRTDGLINDTLYLKRFIGGNYIGNQWEDADDTKIFDDIALKNNLSDYDKQSIISKFDSLYYDTNSKLNETARSITMAIAHLNMDYSRLSRAYYSSEDGRNGGNRTNNVNNGNSNFSYIQYFYEEDDMQLDSISNEFDELSDYEKYVYTDFRLFEDEYKAELKDNYTAVPSEILPRLTALVEATPLDTLDEISSFIVYTIHSNTEYTLTPGAAAAGLDIAEDFLFNRQKGYCVHYATVAALMYRMYGIPARYVSGFVAIPNDFEPVGNGETHNEQDYYAELTDYRAHAWVEIFLDNYGWVPVDVTPSEDGTIEISYPGFGVDKMNQIQEENGWDIDTPSLGENADDVEAETDDNNEIDTQIILDSITLIIIGIVAAIIILIISHRIYIKYKLKNSSTSWIYERFISAVNTSNLLGSNNFTGMEENFANVLTEHIVDIDKSDIDEMIAIANAEYFGNKDVDKENMIRLYNKNMKIIFNYTSIFNKFRFKVVYVICKI